MTEQVADLDLANEEEEPGPPEKEKADEDKEEPEPQKSLEKPESAVTRPKVAPIVYNVDSYNAQIYDSYVHEDFDGCKSLIGEQLAMFGKRAEFAMFMRGVLDRHEGNLEEAISWFTEAHKRAFFWLAKSLFYVKTDLFNTAEKAKDILLQAPVVKENANLLVFLADLYIKLGDHSKAVELLRVACEREPENLDVLTKLGTAYMKIGKEDEAFSTFGNALTYEPNHTKSLLGAASIIQKHGDSDVALAKYRTAVQNCDYSGELWNNLGLAYLSRGKLAAAHSLLKRAAFIKPLSYESKFNLGLCHLAMGLNCSALHFLRAAATLRKDDPKILGAMGMALSLMKDSVNARKAYQRALELNAGLSTHLNYAVFEYRQKKYATAKSTIEAFAALAKKKGDTDLVSRASKILQAITDQLGAELEERE